MFSTTFHYGLISLVDLATSDQLLQTRAIASRHGLSPHYLAEVLTELRRLGLVQSRKGKNGGFQLCCHPSQVNLLDLYRGLAGGAHEWPIAADGTAGRRLGTADPIGSRNRARTWLQQISQRWLHELETTTLADLLGG